MAEFIVIVEGTADEKIATELAERIFIEEISWIKPYLEHNVIWSGLLPNTPCSHWQNVKQIIEQLKSQGIKLPRYLGRKGLKTDGASAYKILRTVQILRKNRAIRAILFIRDLDNQVERRKDLEQAREEFIDRSPEFEIVIGTANPKREAWVLNGFLVNNEQEQEALNEIISEINFNPCLEPERLRETSMEIPQRSRNIKVVLERLTGGDFEREHLCWQDTDLNLLRERGTTSGLTDYLSEVKQRLVPIVEAPE